MEVKVRIKLRVEIKMKMEIKDINRNEDRYMWWIETSGRGNSNTTHMGGIAIAYP